MLLIRRAFTVRVWIRRPRVDMGYYSLGPKVVFETLELHIQSSVPSCPSRRRRCRPLSVRPSRRPSNYNLHKVA